MSLKAREICTFKKIALAMVCKIDLKQTRVGARTVRSHLIKIQARGDGTREKGGGQ